MEDTMAAVKDRVLHMYHTEGALVAVMRLI